MHQGYQKNIENDSYINEAVSTNFKKLQHFWANAQSRGKPFRDGKRKKIAVIFAFTDTEKGEKKKIPAEEGREDGRGENRLCDDDDEEGCEGFTFSPLATLGGPHKNPFFSPFSNGGPLVGYSMYVCLSGLLQAAA